MNATCDHVAVCKVVGAIFALTVPTMACMSSSHMATARDGWTQITAGDAFVMSAPSGTSYRAGGGEDSFVGAIAYEPPGPQLFVDFDYGRYSGDVVGPDKPTLTVDRYVVGRWAYTVVTYPPATWCPKAAALKVEAARPDRSRPHRRNSLIMGGCAESGEELSVLVDMLKSVRMLVPPSRGEKRTG